MDYACLMVAVVVLIIVGILIYITKDSNDPADIEAASQVSNDDKKGEGP